MDEGNERALPTAGADPGSREPAPGSLRLVQALVNTLNAEYGQDLLGTPAAAGRVSYPRESFRGNPSRQYALSKLSAVTIKA